MSLDPKMFARLIEKNVKGMEQNIGVLSSMEEIYICAVNDVLDAIGKLAPELVYDLHKMREAIEDMEFDLESNSIELPTELVDNFDEDSFENDWCDFCVMSVRGEETSDGMVCPVCGHCIDIDDDSSESEDVNL